MARRSNTPIPARVFLCAILAVTALIFSVAASAQSTGSKKPTGAAAQLPPRVYETFQKEYPNASILRVKRETENGAPVFEVESNDHGTLRNIVYSEYGAALEVEVPIPNQDIPANVQSAIAMRCVGCTILKAEKSTRGSVVQYEVTVTTGKGRRRYTQVYAADGQLVSAKR